MESQENTFVVKPQPPLSIIGVLREAFKTTRRNGKLVASILLLVFLSSSQLKLGTELALAPILQDLGSHWQSTASFGSKPAAPFRDAPTSQWANQNKYTYNGEITHTGSIQHVHSSQRANMGSFDYMGKPVSTGELKGLRAFLGVELSILAISCVILLFFLVAAISSSYEAHTAKVMSLKDVFMKFRESWKRPIHTSFCLSLISLGLATLFLIFVGLIPIVAAGSSTYILYAILSITSLVFYVHMAVRWMLSLVVSVLESDSSGLKAIDRAGELMKGKRIQASVLMLLFHFAFGGVHMISNAMTKNLQGWTKMAITIPFTIGLFCVLKLFMFVVYTVYYHERKMSGKEEAVKGQLGRYVPIASAEA